MDNAVKPAQPHLEVANAAPPRGQPEERKPAPVHSLRGGIEQSQSGNEIETFQGGNESVGESSRLKCALTCYSK